MAGRGPVKLDQVVDARIRLTRSDREMAVIIGAIDLTTRAIYY